MLDNELVDMVKQIQLVRSESNKIEIKAANKGCPKVRDSLSSFQISRAEALLFSA